jgi:hypothetical protein
MNGLKLYIEQVDETSNASIFYSRRGDGPFYRWLYEAKDSHWRVYRIDTADFKSRDLSNASWKSVPEELQAQIGQHYLD